MLRSTTSEPSVKVVRPAAGWRHPCEYPLRECTPAVDGILQAAAAIMGRCRSLGGSQTPGGIRAVTRPSPEPLYPAFTSCGPRLHRCRPRGSSS